MKDLTPEQVAEKRRIINEKRKIWRANKVKTDPEFRKRHREYARKWAQENKEKVKESNERYRGSERAKESNRVNSRKYRTKQEWKDYYTPYMREWRKDPVNRFCHQTRTIVTNELKCNPEHIKMINEGYNIDHILPIHLYAQFLYKNKIITTETNKKVALYFKHLINDSVNIRYLKATDNHRRTPIDPCQLFTICEQLETKCMALIGLKTFVKKEIKKLLTK